MERAGRVAIMAASVVVAMQATQAVGQSAAPARDAQRLGKDLTATGAEVAASADGRIPAYAPADAMLPGWAPGKPRADFFKHRADKPLYSIDAANADQHAATLSPGQLALLKQLKGYRMDVYPSRRSCASPAFVAENTRRNVAAAQMGADGWSLKDAVLPGVPFPMPDNGAQAMWNAKLKYAGVGYEWPLNIIALSPRKGSADWIKAGATQTYYYPWGRKGSANLASLPPVEYYTYFAYESPTALAGQALAIVSYTDKPSDTFYYFPGQRRVRRMPTYAYDAPQIGFENQYTMDEPRMFNGSMDRFDWRLAGKKTLVVGYNAFGMYDPQAKLDAVLKPDMPAAEPRRYELHRVWVVEATLKAGVRHVAPKRTFYLDEDSWSIVVAEDYDAQGKLWKLRESFVIPVAETGSCDNPAFVQHNLIDGRYLFDQSPLGAGKDMRWVVETKEPKFTEGFYTADNLRAISER